MVSRKSIALSVFLFTLVAALFPSVSCAIQTGNREDHPSFLVDIKTTVRTTFSNGSFIEEARSGSGAFISPELVVTAAHVIEVEPLSEEEVQRGTRREITNVFVIGTDRNGAAFSYESLHYAASPGWHPNPDDPGEETLGQDIGIVEIQTGGLSPDVEVLPLPHEVDVAVSEQSELIGTIYGRRIPDSVVIERAYNELFTSEGQLSAQGRREFEGNPERREQMAYYLPTRGTSPARSGMFAPFVRMRIPHAPQPLGEPDLFAGRLPRPAILSFDMDREEYINRALEAARMLPFHHGDSGSPFVSRAPNGQLFLAGVVSSMLSESCDDEGVRSVCRYDPMISAQDLRALLRDRFGDGRLDPNRRFWGDPANNVPTAATWSDDQGVRLSELPNDWLLAEVDPELCGASTDSAFCRYLQRGDVRRYEVTAEYIFLSGPEAATNGSGEFRVSGQIGFYSPQNYDYNSVTSSPTDEPAGYAFNVPSGAPRRMLVNERQDNGRNDSEVATVRSSETVTISAAEHNPIICLATSRTVGLLTSGGFVLVPPSEESCIIPSSTNRSCTGDNETHAIWLGGEEEGALVFVDITPITQNDEDIVIAFLGRVWQLPFGLI